MKALVENSKSMMCSRHCILGLVEKSAGLSLSGNGKQPLQLGEGKRKKPPTPQRGTDPQLRSQQEFRVTLEMQGHHHNHRSPTPKHNQPSHLASNSSPWPRAWRKPSLWEKAKLQGAQFPVLYSRS